MCEENGPKNGCVGGVFSGHGDEDVGNVEGCGEVGKERSRDE